MVVLEVTVVAVDLELHIQGIRKELMGQVKEHAHNRGMDIVLIADEDHE